MAGEKCFQENLTFFGDPKTEPEKFNLYNGLLGLAQKVEEIERRTKHIESMLNSLLSR